MNKEFKWDDESVMEFYDFHRERENQWTSESIQQFKESKQPKPEWEIISYRHKQTKEITPKTSTVFHKAMFNNEHEIYSVKRLSDGEVFTIGDIVKYHKASHYGWYAIDNFFIRGDNQILARNKEQSIVEYITEIVKAPDPLFTTNDGVDVYKGDNYYFINTEWEIRYTGDNYNWVGDNLKAFSSKVKAEEYILMNKPLLSANDIISYVVNHSVYKDNYKDLIISLAKEKLNKP